VRRWRPLVAGGGATPCAVGGVSALDAPPRLKRCVCEHRPPSAMASGRARRDAAAAAWAMQALSPALLVGCFLSCVALCVSRLFVGAGPRLGLHIVLCPLFFHINRGSRIHARQGVSAWLCEACAAL